MSELTASPAQTLDCWGLCAMPGALAFRASSASFLTAFSNGLTYIKQMPTYTKAHSVKNSIQKLG